MLNMKRDINQQDFKIVHIHFVKYMSIFHPFEVVDRVSETQLQVGENPKETFWQLEG